jgi:hypothetical protein
MVQAACPDPVAVVLLVVPEKVPNCVPELVALPRLAVQLVISVATLAKMLITVPVVGAVLAVMAVVDWAPVTERLLTKVAQLVAVTVPPVLTAAIDVCPQPESPDPVLQIVLRLVWKVL